MISLGHSSKLAFAFAVLIAASWLLLWAPGAQAASKRGAVLVKDIQPGRSDSTRGPTCGSCPDESYHGGLLGGVGGILYLSVDDGEHGYELWRSNGIRKGTRMVRDISPGAGSSLIDGFTAIDRTFYFSADDDVLGGEYKGVYGDELWQSDGTGRGTRMVKDINPGAMENYFVHHLIKVGNTLYFFGPGGLWRSDGTEAGTSIVKPLPPAAVQATADVNGTLYFSTWVGNDQALWRSDGTEAGTTIVKAGFPFNGVGAGLSYPTGFRGTLYFGADDGVHGTELWRSDGTEAGTIMLKDLNPAGSGSPGPFFEVKGTLYFIAQRSGSLAELWRTDGTEAGTTLVKGVKGGIFGLAVMKGIIYFSSEGGLWRSDGTRRGTTLVKGTRSGGRFAPSALTSAKGTLYFTGTDKKHGEELWRSDGTRRGTRMVRDIRRGTDDSRPGNLTAVGDSLFFTAEDKSHGRELWRAGPKARKKGKPKRKKG
jgi:ELWxxDGT repeat protein